MPVALDHAIGASLGTIGGICWSMLGTEGIHET
jgi:hypothetical protein